MYELLASDLLFLALITAAAFYATAVFAATVRTVTAT